MLNIHTLDLVPWIFQNLITDSFKSLSCNSDNYKELNLWWMRFKCFCCSSSMVMSFQVIESSVSLNPTIFYHSHSSYFSIINLFQILHENKPCSQVMTKTLLLLEAGKYFVSDPFIIKNHRSTTWEGRVNQEALVEIVLSS